MNQSSQLELAPKSHHLVYRETHISHKHVSYRRRLNLHGNVRQYARERSPDITETIPLLRVKNCLHLRSTRSTTYAAQPLALTRRAGLAKYRTTEAPLLHTKQPRTTCMPLQLLKASTQLVFKTLSMQKKCFERQPVWGRLIENSIIETGRRHYVSTPRDKRGNLGTIWRQLTPKSFKAKTGFVSRSLHATY